jgi:hypothetical protein
MLKDILYFFKTDEEWFVLRKNNFSFKEIGKKEVTHCNYNSIRVVTYKSGDDLKQLFIHIPALNKTFFLSCFYPGLNQFTNTLTLLKEKNKFLGPS